MKKTNQDWYYVLLLPFLGLVLYLSTDFNSRFYEEAHIWLPILTIIGSFIILLPKYNKR